MPVPFSIFALNDYIACDLYVAAAEAGLVIGKDVYIAGFWRYPYVQTARCTFNKCFHKNNQKVGYEGAKLLHMHMKGLLNQPVHQKIPGQLYARQSTDTGSE